MAITLTIVERKTTGKIVKYKRGIELFVSTDKARKRIKPIVKEMAEAKAANRPAQIYIDGVSYDTDSEKKLLLELKAVTSTENEEQ